jgi:hypothetical protein
MLDKQWIIYVGGIHNILWYFVDVVR